MIILGIESSCDETAAAVVEDCRHLRSSIVCSQVDLHAVFGGVVPEVASRRHVELVNFAVDQALAEAECKPRELDAIAVTCGPGLIGALLVGLCAAKGLAYAWRLPLVGVDHLRSHVYATFLHSQRLGVPDHAPTYPFIALTVSGGHSDITLHRSEADVSYLGRTRDDAAGEAFDKVARALNLGYPGGPTIDRLAASGDPHAVAFPRADLGDSYDFSFSGLKTAVARHIQGYDGGSELPVLDIVASFQQAVVDALIANTMRAVRDHGARHVVLAGGVAANSQLRRCLAESAAADGVEFYLPPFSLCTDNAAMVACAGSYRFARGETDDFDLDAYSTVRKS